MKKTRQLCAIKVVKKKDILKDDTADSSMLERNILALGRKCRFLTALVAAFQSTERLFFVMEFVSGGDLFHHIVEVLMQHLVDDGELQKSPFFAEQKI